MIQSPFRLVLFRVSWYAHKGGFTQPPNLRGCSVMALANLTNIFTFYVRSPLFPFYLFLDLFLRQFAVVRTNVTSHLSVVFNLTVPPGLRAHSRALSPQSPVGLYPPHFRILKVEKHTYRALE